MPHYSIQHTTKYSYPTPVIDCTNQIKLYPIQNQVQNVIKHELIISGKPLVEEFYDYFGNKVGVFTSIKPHNELVIQSEIKVFTNPSVPIDDVMTPVTQWQYLAEIKENPSYIDFLTWPFFNSFNEIINLVYSLFSPTRHSPLATAKIISEYVYKNFTYQKGITSVETEVDDFWKLKAGVCQDFTLLTLLMLRLAGVPSKYVSGYICPKNHELRGEGATHAWVEIYLPYYGWLGIDPTNNCVVSDRHVKLAVGRNFNDCSPVKGTYKGSGEHTLEVSVSIENGFRRKDFIKPETKPFSYTVKKEDPESNSYRQFVEMQQQQ
jgi:transglutaminase-like putative cysteine protease